VSSLSQHRLEAERAMPRAKLDFERMEFGEERDQILQAAPEEIHRPCHDHVEPALAFSAGGDGGREPSNLRAIEAL
jgi:hypothetical protein